jgi:DNA polymerase I-like protein with 3'-5' exonuclease and polymerase domains
MIVTTLEHGRLVFESLRNALWLAIDTETQNKPKFKGKKDALVFGRTDIRLWSICYKGVSYSFPTNKFHPRFPLMVEWFELLEPIARQKKIVPVFANAGYDTLVFWGVKQISWNVFWDVIIGGWMANPTIDKSLKARAPLYGRHLGSLKISKKSAAQGYTAVSDKSLKSYAEYGEEDVIVTDEQYQMQINGYIDRPAKLRYIQEDGSYLVVKNPMPTGKIEIAGEKLPHFEQEWIRLQELPVLHSVVEATVRGFPVLRNELMQIRERLVSDEKDLLKRIYRLAKRKINLRSRQQVGAMLRSLKIGNPFRTKTGQDKVDTKSLFKLQTKTDHPILGFLIQLSKVQKLLGYVSLQPDKGLLWYIADDNRIHCTQNSIGAITGRFSSQNPNLHQIPSQADMYGMKYVFVAPGIKWVNNPKLRPKEKTVRLKKPKKAIIDFDYKQLEIMVMCMFSKCKSMEKILRDPDGDIHQDTSDQFTVERDPTAKQINFLLQFGGKEYTLAEKLTTEGVPTTESTASAYIKRYDEVRPEVRPFRESLLQEHQEKGYITLLFGRRRWLKDVNWANDWERHKAETTLTNNCIQGSGQDLLKASIIRNDPNRINIDREFLARRTIEDKFHKALLNDYARKIEKYRRLYRLAKLEWLLQVHDETLNMCDLVAAEDIAHMIGEVMTWRHFFPAITDYNVPLVAEGGVGYSWGQAKNKKEALFRIEKGHDEWEYQPNQVSTIRRRERPSKGIKFRPRKNKNARKFDREAFIL